jgi:hypothetical protein
MKTFQEFLEEARKLQNIQAKKPSGTIPIPGAEGKARGAVARAGYRQRGPVQNPKVSTDWKQRNGPDVPTYVRTHSNPRQFAANVAKKAYKEGEKNVRSTVRGLRSQLSGVKGAVHDITLGNAKSKLNPGQKARAFLKAIKNVPQKAIEAGAKTGDLVVNKPTNISSSGPKKSRSDSEGAAKRGSIYSKAGMSTINPRTGYQTAPVPKGIGGGSSSLPNLGNASGSSGPSKKRFTPGSGQSFGISGIKLAN